MCMPICTLGLNLRFDLCLPWRHCACARTGLDPRAVVFVRHLRTVLLLVCFAVRLGVVGHRGAGARFCMLRSTTRRCRWAPWSWCLVLASRAVVVEGPASYFTTALPHGVRRRPARAWGPIHRERPHSQAGRNVRQAWQMMMARTVVVAPSLLRF